MEAGTYTSMLDGAVPFRRNERNAGSPEVLARCRTAAELLRVLDEEIVACRKCPRLVAYREKVAREKRRAYRDWVYWGKPVPGFGDPRRATGACGTCARSARLEPHRPSVYR